MKRRTNRMATIVATVIIAAATTIMLSSYESRRLGDDMWKMMGLTQQAGNESIKNSFLNGYLYYYGAKNAKNVALNDRVALAKDLLVYTKSYVSSPEFAKLYQDERQRAKPVEPVAKALRTIAEIQKAEIERTEKSIKDAAKTIKELGGDAAKNMQPLVDLLKQNLKDYQDPRNSYFSAILAGEKYDRDNTATRYQEDMKAWEKKYPAEVKAFVADKLQRLLDYTKDIDYSAELIEKYGKKRFVNQTYEAKRAEWKLGYRAGKGVTETVREFSANWIQELGR